MENNNKNFFEIDRDEEVREETENTDSIEAAKKVVSAGNPENTENPDSIKTESKEANEAPAASRRFGGKRAKKEKKPEENHGVLYELFEWIKVIVVAAICALLINSFIIANSTVPTGSMENTIPVGSRVFGSRLTYTFGEVKRGDVAIFLYGYQCKKDHQMYRENSEGKCPYDGTPDSQNTKVYYVKRVIGLPGDHVEIKQTGYVDASEIKSIPVSSADGKVPVGTVYVNGEAITETYLPEPMIVDPTVEVNASGDSVMFPPVDVTVPEGCYYVLGDNRNNSADARYWGENNFVKRDRMVAKVYVRYWPLNEIGLVK